MRLLVVAATEMEIAPLKGQNISAEYLITGVGSPACLYSLTKLLQQQKYDCVLQGGIAGTFNPEIGLGDTFLVEKDGFADLGIIEKGRLSTLFESGLADKKEWPYTDGWLVNNHNLLSRSALEKVTSVTVNTVSDDMNIAAQYRQVYQADLESMEGAAFHYVCLQENIPFIQIRAVSNRVGERDKSNWQLKAAIENLNKEIILLFDQISNHF